MTHRDEASGALLGRLERKRERGDETRATVCSVNDNPPAAETAPDADTDATADAARSGAEDRARARASRSWSVVAFSFVFFGASTLFMGAALTYEIIQRDRALGNELMQSENRRGTVESDRFDAIMHATQGYGREFGSLRASMTAIQEELRAHDVAIDRLEESKLAREEIDDAAAEALGAIARALPLETSSVVLPASGRTNVAADASAPPANR